MSSGSLSAINVAFLLPFSQAFARPIPKSNKRINRVNGRLASPNEKIILQNVYDNVVEFPRNSAKYELAYTYVEETFTKLHVDVACRLFSIGKLKNDIKVKYNIILVSPAVYKVEVFASIRSYTSNSELLHEIETLCGGIFRIHEENEAVLQTVLNVYCPAEIFDKVRSVVYTSTYGTGHPLSIDEIDCDQLYQLYRSNIH